MARRAALLALFVIALGGCGSNDGPDDPAVAAPGTGIPMGAVSAAGVRFDPPAPASEPLGKSRIREDPPRGLPDVMPPDPFGDPLDAPHDKRDAGAAPHHPDHPPHKGLDL